MIKENFRGKGRLLVKLLVGQALLIGVLTFLCLIRPGGEDIQAQANRVVDQDATMLMAISQSQFHHINRLIVTLSVK